MSLRKTDKISLVLIFGLSLTIRDLFAETANNFIELQSGSMLGLLHISNGWIFADKHQLSLGVGYVPELDNHHELLLFSFKYRFQGITSYKLASIGSNVSFSPVNFGITGVLSNNDALSNDSSKQIPNDYYYPNGKRILINYQMILAINETHDFYIDFAVVDIGAVNYVRNFKFYVNNYDYLGLDGIVVYGVGTRFKF